MRDQNRPTPRAQQNTPEGGIAGQLAETWSRATQEGIAEGILKKQASCQICGARVHLSHVTDFHRNLTQETACCPECGVQLRRSLHRLQ